MNADPPTRALAALATPQALAVLRAIKDAEWHIASAAAVAAGVHVSTASKHLAALHEAGVLERKEVRTATGHAFAYRLPRETITLTIDLGAPTREGGRDGGAVQHLADVLAEADAVAGSACRAGLVGALDAAWPAAFAGLRADDLDARVSHLRSRSPAFPEGEALSALRRVRGYLDSTLGPAISNRIFEAAIRGTGPPGSSGRADGVDAASPGAGP